MPIQAIETRYADCRFRSRTEARWAVFFTSLGLKWEYEPEGFELSNGRRYLPDFRVALPNSFDTLWVEVKGQQPTAAEITALELVCDNHRQAHGMFAVGMPGDERVLVRNCYYDEARKDRPEWVSCSLIGGCRQLDLLFSTETVRAAVTAAKSARFEHGERPIA